MKGHKLLRTLTIFTIIAYFLFSYYTNADGQELQFLKSPYKLSQGALGYNYNDKITQVHEDTHGVNSLLRNKFGGNCFFLGESTFVRFVGTPSGVTLTQVANSCKHKGEIFNLYLVNSRRWWNDTPLYVYDEWVSYTNGSAKQVWFGSDARGRGTTDCSLYYMFEMGYYCHVALECLPDSYTDKENLKNFWVWHATRNIAISDDAKKINLYSDKQEKWRSIIEELLNNK